MSEVTLTAETGREIGTGPSRRARTEGRIPGVVYGGGEPAIVITVDRKDLRRALGTEAGHNALITVEVDGQSLVTIVREVQRHPVRREVTHIDFLKVDPTRPIEVEVPIHLSGEPKKVTTQGGITEQRISVLKMRVRPDSIPDSIDVDITDMTLDRSILVKDLVMPEGCIALSNPQQAVVTAELTRAAITAARSGGADAAS
jgi:large subunit ribosomal protein L25